MFVLKYFEKYWELVKSDLSEVSMLRLMVTVTGGYHTFRSTQNCFRVSLDCT